MKQLATVAILALSLAAAPLGVGCKKSHDTASTTPGASDALTLPLAPRAPGMRWTKNDVTSTDLRFGEGPDATPITSKREHVTANEILAVDGAGVITKVAVTYQTWRDVTTGAGGGGEQPSELEGKSYVVWVEGTGLAATHADGSDVTPAELAAIAGDQDELGKPPVMEQVMSRHTWEVGKRVDLTQQELDLLASTKAGGPRATSMSFTLEEVRAGAAWFAIAMRMADATGSGRMTIDATGKVVVDIATGRPIRVEIRGPVNGTAGGMTVAGTMSGVVTYDFAK